MYYDTKQIHIEKSKDIKPSFKLILITEHAPSRLCYTFHVTFNIYIIMKYFRGNWFDNIDPIITSWMNRNGLRLLRISVGIVFVWFGVLKFFPGLSPAQGLAINTIKMLTFNLVSETIIINGLALWEVLIGIGLISGRFMRETLLLLFLQMIGTFSPVFLFPNEVFTQIPYAPTMEGQYIIKNIIIISAGIVLGGALRSRSDNSLR